AEHGPATMSKIREPAPQRCRQRGACEFHAVPVRPSRFRAYRVLEFLQALFPRQPQGSAEVITGLLQTSNWPCGDGEEFFDHTKLFRQLVDWVCEREIPGDFTFDSYFT
ncbi:MAG TPA: hypothetical protein VMY37_24895, partial [Thermoguttaceae bacterium]|nr:hypothetical protein [Thermoguttaceae bacterium]